MSKKTFDSIEECLFLHPTTLPSLYCSRGLFSKYTLHDNSDATKQLSVILREPTSLLTGHGLFSMTYQYDSRTTTALILRHPNWQGSKSSLAYSMGLGRLWSASQDLWYQPLFLPTLVLQLHWSLLQSQLYDIAHELHRQEFLIYQMNPDPNISPEDFRKFSNSFDILQMGQWKKLQSEIFDYNGIQWAPRCIEFLTELQNVLRHDSFVGIENFYQMRDCLEYVGQASRSTAQYYEVCIQIMRNISEFVSLFLLGTLRRISETILGTDCKFAPHKNRQFSTLPPG